jgi:SAM-dependent methyltransferase
MNLSSEYKQQFGWRAWPKIFDTLPPLRGQVVLDLGCATGDQAAELVARGARVIGVDLDPKLIEEARSRKLRNADFRQLDLRILPDLGVVADESGLVSPRQTAAGEEHVGNGRRFSRFTLPFRYPKGLLTPRIRANVVHPAITETPTVVRWNGGRELLRHRSNSVR